MGWTYTKMMQKFFKTNYCWFLRNSKLPKLNCSKQFLQGNQFYNFVPSLLPNDGHVFVFAQRRAKHFVRYFIHYFDFLIQNCMKCSKETTFNHRCWKTTGKVRIRLWDGLILKSRKTSFLKKNNQICLHAKLSLTK